MAKEPSNYLSYSCYSCTGHSVNLLLGYLSGVPFWDALLVLIWPQTMTSPGLFYYKPQNLGQGTTNFFRLTSFRLKDVVVPWAAHAREQSIQVCLLGR